jgi:hypothetical protein
MGRWVLVTVPPNVRPSKAAFTGRGCSGRRMKLSVQVAGNGTSFRAALATVPSDWFVTYRLPGTLDRPRKLDMAQHCKCIADGDDGSKSLGCEG